MITAGLVDRRVKLEVDPVKAAGETNGELFPHGDPGGPPDEPFRQPQAEQSPFIAARSVVEPVRGKPQIFGDLTGGVD